MAKILIVEDERPLREEIAEWLLFEGYDVFQASDGAEALILLGEMAFDVVLSDIMMQGFDGYELVKRLRQLDNGATVPVILMSALAERSNIRTGMGIGADDYLIKPFTRLELLDALAARIARIELHRNETESALEDLRNRVLSNLPHELRTPLNGIIGFGDTLSSDPSGFSHDELSEIGNIISKSGKRLFRLVHNYLMYLQLDLAQHTGRQFSEAGLAESTIFSAARTAASDHLRDSDLILKIKTYDLKISRIFLEKIIYELTDNAMRYSTPGKPVKVSSGKHLGVFRIAVTDEGRGMSQKQISEIGAFVQFDRPKYEQQGGGMGLALLRKIVDKISGQLYIKSKPAQGTSVFIELPLADE